MKIYLAGTVGSNWRNEIVKNYDLISQKVWADYIYSDNHHWPILPKVIFGEHDYVGPFHLGYSGYNTHGIYKHGGDIMAMDIIQLCNEAIKKCDLFYAWIDRSDIYGTILEIGIAKTLNKEVVISGTDKFDDMWFVYDSVMTIGLDRDCDNWENKPKDMLQAHLNERVKDLKLMPYKDYLQSPHWISVRKSALDLYGNKCQVCNSPVALEVHHRTYERRGDELLEDVIVLCAKCHDLFHKNGKLK